MDSAAAGIDHDRGCIIRFHPSGMRIVMYYDAPGQYFDERNTRMSDKMAQAAGFDTGKLASQRERNARLMQMREAVDKEFAAFEDRLAAAASQGFGALSVRHLGNAAYAVFNGEERLSPFDMTIDEAKGLLASISEEGDAGDAKTEPTDATGAEAGTDEERNSAASASAPAAKGTARGPAADPDLI